MFLGDSFFILRCALSFFFFFHLDIVLAESVKVSLYKYSRVPFISLIYFIWRSTGWTPFYCYENRPFFIRVYVATKESNHLQHVIWSTLLNYAIICRPFKLRFERILLYIDSIILRNGRLCQTKAIFFTFNAIIKKCFYPSQHYRFSSQSVIYRTFMLKNNDDFKCSLVWPNVSFSVSLEF